MINRDKFDVLTPDSIPPIYNDNSHQADDLHSIVLQRKKWLVFGLSFLIVLFSSLLIVWTKPAIYQSQALIHFSYLQPINQSHTLMPTEQIALNQQRLTHIRILNLLKSKVFEVHGIQVTPENLSNMLAVKANLNSQTLTLTATGENARWLAPILSVWLDTYLQLLDEEVDKSGIEKAKKLSEVLVALGVKINEHKQLLTEFGRLNNIVSLEREENRVLNKIKALNASLDDAERLTFKTTELLEKIKKTKLEGRVITHPNDAKILANLSNSIIKLRGQLNSFAEKYTEQYMTKDPKIIGINKRLLRLEDNLYQSERQSEDQYFQDINRQKEASIVSTAKLSKQLTALSSEAQMFDQKLKEFKRMNQSLNQLTEQAQVIKNKLIEEQVQGPSSPHIKILDKPFEPSYPISPNYLLNSLYCFVAALITSIVSLIIFSFIVKPKQTSSTVSNFNVVRPLSINEQERQSLTLTDDSAHRSSPKMLDQKPSNQHSSTPNLRLITNNECQQLLNYSTQQGKLILALLLSGVSLKEIISIRVTAIDVEYNALSIEQDFLRTCALPKALTSIFSTIVDIQDPTTKIIGEDITLDDITQLLINTAHDAAIPFPEQITVEVLRHTYLTFLALQGARLNDLEKVAGYIQPTELAFYRGVSRKEVPLGVDELTTLYPLNWSQE